MKTALFIAFICLILSSGCFPDPGSTGHIRKVSQNLDLTKTDQNHDNWLTYGLNYAETRFSGLDEITPENVDELGLAWSYDLGLQRGIEATPLVVDGIMYVSGPWSVVWAFDVRKGELLWSWDPKIDRQYARFACCDVVNRGVALYDGKVFIGTLDGRLVALDAATGHPVWSTQTVDRDRAYTITGAPRVVNGKVIIGNGGADLGVRGYVSAYDAAWGNLLWRTYTVPGDPNKPFESEALEIAAETWSGEWWKYGGGGTAWDAMAFDPDLNLLYVGTGNGAPWSRQHRSNGAGDNLYLSSILALNPENGALVWHYQTTPGDTWDYTSTQHLILADLTIENQERMVIMQAPKNGFFYLIDRTNGEFISATPYTEVTWATGIDEKTGRPVVPPENYYEDAPVDISPSPFGGHNWQPMAYNPNTGLVYIPIREHTFRFSNDTGWEYRPGQWNTGTQAYQTQLPAGFLIAWDPVKQEEVWRQPLNHHWNGGVVTTASNLVFQGTGDGRFVAYHARTGDILYEAFLGTGTIGSPVTYAVDGTQYVSIVSGWGGAGGLTVPPAGDAGKHVQHGRVFTFVLDGDSPFPEYPFLSPITAPPGLFEYTAEEVASGLALYRANCGRCHGWNLTSSTGVPDLRRASVEVHEQFEEIVFGARLSRGMPSFAGVLSPEDVHNIHALIIDATREAAAGEE